MKEWLLPIIIAIIGSGALSAAVTKLVDNIMHRKDEKSVLLKAVRQILCNSIIENCRECIRNGEKDGEDMKRLLEDYEIYKELDGNGYIDSYLEQVKKLPIRAERRDHEAV